MRIVSLVPSLTHLISDLGMRDYLVGCTSFCIEPPGLHKTAVLCGGTKDPDLAKIAALLPTHVLVNEEENKPEHIDALRKFTNVLNTFPKSPEDVPGLIRDVCKFLCIVDDHNYASQIETLIAEVKQLFAGTPKKSFMYFIWRNPWMVVSEDTYISHLLSLLGYRNVCVTENRYPEVTFPLVGDMPEVVFFSTEPFPFRKRDVVALKNEWPDHPTVIKADGMLCSWYGSMLIKTLKEMKKYRQDEPQQLFISMEVQEEG